MRDLHFAVAALLPEKVHQKRLAFEAFEGHPVRHFRRDDRLFTRRFERKHLGRIRCPCRQQQCRQYPYHFFHNHLCFEIIVAPFLERKRAFEFVAERTGTRKFRRFLRQLAEHRILIADEFADVRDT